MTHSKKPKSTSKKCCVKYCRHRVRSSEKSNKCAKHRSAAFKEKFPLKYYFNILKQTAKRRGLAFTLVYLDYECLCKKTGYDVNRGKTKDSLSIDRVNNKRGYHLDNVQIITLSANSSKQHRKQFVPYFREPAEEPF
jgi:cytochrome c oxidase assembly protein Cox11